MTSKPEPMLYLSDARGVYIPRDFANETRHDCVAGVDQETWDTLAAGPDSEWYWDAWQDLQDNARVTDPDSGIVYSVYQDGDCWLIPDGMEYDERTGFFAWPDEATGED